MSVESVDEDDYGVDSSGAPQVQVVLLFTSMTSDKLIRVNQERLEQLLYVRGVPFKQVDASEPENKALREALFDVSGLRFVYPQAFLEREDGSYSFVGDFRAVHTMIEHDEVDGAFDRAFSACQAYAATLSGERRAWLATHEGGPAAGSGSGGGSGGDDFGGAREDRDGDGTADAGAGGSEKSPQASSSAAAAAGTAQGGAVWERAVSRKTGEGYWVCRATGEASWVDPRPGAGGGKGPGGLWVEQSDARGRTYFYNRKTGKSAWALPTG